MNLDKGLVGKVFLLLYTPEADRRRLDREAEEFGYPDLKAKPGGIMEVRFKPDNRYAMFQGEIGYMLNDARFEDGTEFDPHLNRSNLVEITEIRTEDIVVGKFYRKRGYPKDERKLILKLKSEFRTPLEYVGKEVGCLGSRGMVETGVIR